MEESYHIIFDKQILRKLSKNVKLTHNSWFLEPIFEEFKFGGKIKNELNRLIEFTDASKIIKTVSAKRLILAINFELFFNAQLNEKILSYEHDKMGVPSLLIQNIKISNEYSNFPLEETKIKLAITPSELLEQEWLGNTNKIIGRPTWVQEKEILICPKCNGEMIFLIQLSSSLPDMNEWNNFEIMFGNDGELYGFWCDKDRVSSYIWQCT